ncbi:MAG: ABC transporter permease [Gammaproteobacteria bacterium]|nr:ABC transporter permease [Gammaproteobacteria bacterium]
MAGTFTVATKELRDQFGSKRFLIMFGLVLLLSTLSAYQGVDFIRDYEEMGFLNIFSGTKFDFSFIQIMGFFGPLLGLALGFDAINKERANGTLSILLGQPIFRDSVINGKFIAGAAALATLTLGTIGIVSGLAIPMLGFGPTGMEASKILAFTLLTVVYLLFWLSLGILYSVLAKRMSISFMASIATWITFSIVISILASVIAGIMVPLPGRDFRMPSDKSDFKTSPEFMETEKQRYVIQSSIENISPTNLYEKATSDILSMGFNKFKRTRTLTEVLAANWANIATIIVGLVICFSASYIVFLRSEIRPGD